MKIKNNNGFTLLEIIISIAALSFISVFILQMFLSAQTLNTRAKDSDTAISKAISAIDDFKKSAGPDGYYLADSLKLFDISENENLTKFTVCYDKEWNPIENGLDAKYYLQMEINSDNEITVPQIEGVLYGRLYTVTVEVTENASGGSDRTLALLKSKKYFPAKQD